MGWEFRCLSIESQLAASQKYATNESGRYLANLIYELAAKVDELEAKVARLSFNDHHVAH